MVLIIHQNPFKIQVITLTNVWRTDINWGILQTIRNIKPLSLNNVHPSRPAEFQRVSELEIAYKTIWETSSKALRWHIHPDHSMLRNVVLEVLKSGHAEYLGFGLQGGTEFMKRTTYMNYFSELCLSLPSIGLVLTSLNTATT